MKRLIVSILAVLFTVCISTSAMAASSNSTDEQREGVNAMFATETITSGIRNTIDMEQLSSFFDGEEVQIDLIIYCQYICPSIQLNMWIGIKDFWSSQIPIWLQFMRRIIHY